MIIEDHVAVFGDGVAAGLEQDTAEHDLAIAPMRVDACCEGDGGGSDDSDD